MFLIDVVLKPFLFASPFQFPPLPFCVLCFLFSSHCHPFLSPLPLLRPLSAPPLSLTCPFSCTHSRSCLSVYQPVCNQLSAAPTTSFPLPSPPRPLSQAHLDSESLLSLPSPLLPSPQSPATPPVPYFHLLPPAHLYSESLPSLRFPAL